MMVENTTRVTISYSNNAIPYNMESLEIDFIVREEASPEAFKTPGDDFISLLKERSYPQLLRQGPDQRFRTCHRHPADL